MASSQQQTASKTEATPGANSVDVKRAQRRKLRKAGREKLTAKLRTDKEFAKTYFEARSKRANDKKVGFRKKKSRKK